MGPQTHRFNIEYTLSDAGWARTAFEYGDSRCEFEHGYGGDPLASLATVAVLVAKGGGLLRSEARFDGEEQGGWLAVFSARDPTQFELFRCKDVWKEKATDPTLLMSGEIDSLEFAVRVGHVLHQLVRQVGLTGYLRKWQTYAFPFMQYFHLRLLLDQSKLIETIWETPGEQAFSLELTLLSTDPIWAPVRRVGPFGGLDLPYRF